MEENEEGNIETENSEAEQSEGDKSTADEEVAKLNADTERINKAIAENENAKARQKLGGFTDAGQQPVKKEKISDKEYAEKALSGELNDGKKE